MSFDSRVEGVVSSLSYGTLSYNAAKNSHAQKSTKGSARVGSIFASMTKARAAYVRGFIDNDRDSVYMYI